jgi:alpha-tubulin suppressor-like RCC1 family protein
MFSFGDSTDRCLGHEDDELQILPKEIEALRDMDVASVSATHVHVLAVTYGGEVYSWGSSKRHAALGRGPPAQGDTAHGKLPRRIEALRGVRVRSVAAGYKHSCAVTHAGELYTWGGGCGGERPQQSWVTREEFLPWKVDDEGYINVVGVAAGYMHTLVAGSDGKVYCLGLGRAYGESLCDINYDDEEEYGQLRLMSSRSFSYVAVLVATALWCTCGCAEAASLARQGRVWSTRRDRAQSHDTRRARCRMCMQV